MMHELVGVGVSGEIDRVFEGNQPMHFTEIFRTAHRLNLVATGPIPCPNSSAPVPPIAGCEGGVGWFSHEEEEQP
jgi:hypothetical protein